MSVPGRDANLLDVFVRLCYKDRWEFAVAGGFLHCGCERYDLFTGHLIRRAGSWERHLFDGRTAPTDLSEERPNHADLCAASGWAVDTRAGGGRGLYEGRWPNGAFAGHRDAGR